MPSCINCIMSTYSIVDTESTLCRLGVKLYSIPLDSLLLCKTRILAVSVPG